VSITVSGCIVLFKNDRQVLYKAINSFLNADSCGILYLVDNSPTDELRDVYTSDKIVYIHNSANNGFGAGHNIGIKLAFKSNSKYHLIMNPDIYFGKEVITPMINYMNEHHEVGMMMPKILNSDNTIQYLPKLLPNPFWILRRKFKKPALFNNSFLNHYELRQVPATIEYNSPILSGCFSLVRLQAMIEIGGYDDKYFMYFEDFDLSRRMHQKYKTMYFPTVSVYHEYERGANKNAKLFKIFIFSAITYFNKWGWFFDRERKRINRQTLDQF
jgi:GT2 family glycosyltransferase